MTQDATVLILVFVWMFVSARVATAPTCAPTIYPVSLGINTTDGTVLETITCTANTGALSFSINTAQDGHDYFSVDETTGELTLANRLDVEYGQIKWDVFVVATDGGGPTTATVSLTTFRSTTTTTSTQPPPGYDWFDNTNNKYLFWAVMGFMALIVGTCILCCVRFHRKGTCLPKSWPQFNKMIDSFNRQFDCCPIPCDYYNNHEKADYFEGIMITEQEDDTPFGLPPRKPKPVTPKKSVTPKQSVTPNQSYTKKKDVLPEPEEPEREVISPIVIGNVNLNDVGFDGMRSPGFNAPMFTTYGGKKGTASKVFKKY